MMRLDVLLALASLKQFHYQLYIGDVALATALRSMALIKPQFTWTVSIKLLFPNYLTSFFSVCNKGVRRGHNRTQKAQGLFSLVILMLNIIIYVTPGPSLHLRMWPIRAEWEVFRSLTLMTEVFMSPLWEIKSCSLIIFDTELHFFISFQFSVTVRSVKGEEKKRCTRLKG